MFKYLVINKMIIMGIVSGNIKKSTFCATTLMLLWYIKNYYGV